MVPDRTQTSQYARLWLVDRSTHRESFQKQERSIERHNFCYSGSDLPGKDNKSNPAHSKCHERDVWLLWKWRDEDVTAMPKRGHYVSWYNGVLRIWILVVSWTWVSQRWYHPGYCVKECVNRGHGSSHLQWLSREPGAEIRNFHMGLVLSAVSADIAI